MDNVWVNGLYLSDPDWNESYVAVSRVIPIQATVFLTFDPVQEEVTASEFRDLRIPEYQSFETDSFLDCEG